MRVYKGKVIKIVDKSCTVEVERYRVHPLYKKRLKKKRRYHVSNTQGVKVGQKVSFVDSRPFSKTKRWKILREGEAK